MKKIMLPLFISLAILLAGCVVTSVYPFYQEKDVIFDPTLLGKWIDASTNTPKEGSSEVIRFVKAGENGYAISREDSTNVAQIVSAHLFKLGGQTFFDWCGGEPEQRIPAHYLYKVSQISTRLQLHPLDYSWLESLLKKNPTALRHIVVHDKPGDSSQDRIVLTADTGDLQNFLLKYMDQPKVFIDGALQFKREDATRK